MNDKQSFADVFGIKYPVCSPDQKERLEAAFKSAIEWEEKNGGLPKFDCYCEMVITLLNPDAPRGAVISAGADIAKMIYEKKEAGIALMQALMGMRMVDAAFATPIKGSEKGN